MTVWIPVVAVVGDHVMTSFVVLAAAVPLADWVTMVNEATLTFADPPVTRVVTVNWFGVGVTVEPGDSGLSAGR